MTMTASRDDERDESHYRRGLEESNLPIELAVEIADLVAKALRQPKPAEGATPVARYTQMGSGMVASHDTFTGKPCGDWVKVADYERLERELAEAKAMLRLALDNGDEALDYAEKATAALSSATTRLVPVEERMPTLPLDFLVRWRSDLDGVAWHSVSPFNGKHFITPFSTEHVKATHWMEIPEVVVRRSDSGTKA